MREQIAISFIILKRDLNYYLQDKRNFFIFIIVYLSGLLIFLSSLNNMLGNDSSYFIFLIIGYLVVSYLNINGGAGFEILNEKILGKWDYDKLIPISRTHYSLLRVLGISLRGYLNFIFCMLIILPFIYTFFSLKTFLLFLFLSMILSIIFTSTSLLPLIAVNHDNMSIHTFLGIFIHSWLLLGSTIYYPFNSIPFYLQIIVIINPVTWILEFIRSEMNIVGAMKFPIIDTIIIISFFFIISLWGSMKALLKLN